MALKDWEKRESSKNYFTWRKKDNRVGNYNRLYLVAKTEMGEWIVFLSLGDAGVSVLSNPRNEVDALNFAKEYMRKH